MEALVLLIFFAAYILVRVVFGVGKTDWEKQWQIHEEGIRFLQSNQMNLAGEYFEAAVINRPHDALSFVMLGRIALSQQETERALMYGSRALRLDNSIWQAHLLMSKAFHQTGDFSASLLNARNAVWFGRNTGETYHWYGKLLLESGEMDKGLEMLNESYRLGEEHAGWLLRKKGSSGNQKKSS
jgi:Tfp pilus assembly protein PilF